VVIIGCPPGILHQCAANSQSSSPFILPLLSVFPFMQIGHWSMMLDLFLPHLPSATMPAPQIFPWILRCSHDYIRVLSRCSSSGMTFYDPIYCLPSYCSCLSHPPRAPLLFFLFHIITLSAHLFADILDINTSRDPRVTSLALIVVRLHPRTIPMFLRRHSTLLIMFASCQHYETIC